MADKLVDILGFLQPDSGNNWNEGLYLDGNAKIIFAFEDAVPYVGSGFGYYSAGEAAYSDKSYTYSQLYAFLNDRKLLPDVPDKTNLPPVIVGYSGPNTNKQNIIVNMNQRPIFRKVYYSKWPCLKELEKSGLQRYLLTVQDHVESYERFLLRGNVTEANKRESSYTRDLNLLVENIKEEVDAGSWDKKKIPACFLPDPDPALAGPPSQTIYGTLNKPPSVDDPNIKLPSQTPKQLDPNKALTEINNKEDDLDKMMDKSSADLDKQMSSSGDPFAGTSTDPFESTSSPSVNDPNATSTRTVTETTNNKTVETVTGGDVTVRTSFASDDPRSRMTQDQLAALPNGAGQTEYKIPGKDSITTTTDSVTSKISEVKTPTGTDVVSKLEVDSKIKVETPKVPKVEQPKFVKDGLGENWSPDKYKPETIAGNTKFVDPSTGGIGSTEKIAAVDKLKSSIPDVPKPNLPSLPANPVPETVSNADAALSKLSNTGVGSLNANNAITPPNTLVQAATGGLVGGGLGAGVGALAGGGQGALIGGLSGVALGGGLAIGGIGGGALAGAGLGGGIGALAGGGRGALIGTAAGGTLGAAAAKLALVKKGMPKPKIPKPPSAPRLKKVKVKAPSNTKGAEDLLNLQKSKLAASKAQVDSQITANIDMNKLNSLGGIT
jgi:hypothetical protein